MPCKVIVVKENEYVYIPFEGLFTIICLSGHEDRVREV
jgi:hypothetical protein